MRIGILGAARIAPPAVVRPARVLDGVEIAAIASRDRARAERFARRHGIGTVHDDYETLLADDTVDAIYNPLPNGLHGRWTIAALEAGKHVLCEKPFAANADEAAEVAAIAANTDRVVMEAFHYRYHPLANRLVEIARSGELGAVTHVEAWMCAPILPRKDIRWQLALAGGATMDVGCYPIHLVRSVVGAEPEVVRASARERVAGVDRWLQAELAFDGGATARITASMLSRRLVALGAMIRCERGDIRVLNPFVPQLFHRLTIHGPDGTRRERFGRTATYVYQLRAFAGAVAHGEPFPTGVDDAVANMRVIDACYLAAGMAPRQPTI